MSSTVWGYLPDSGYRAGATLVGYSVEAVDGSIGKVDKHSDEVDSAHLVVDTGPWILGRRIVLPAGTVTGIDQEEEKVYVGRTRQEIKDAPAFEGGEHVSSPDYLHQVGVYFGAFPLV
ncbi:PRC-barrel domain containing protein [Streptomyces sp. DSM 41527]|uniref:PRC-barrel domain containing protein n=1 Tax=Streptomyces mooreae TaxID=3075523 RepID=A0ABU2T8Y1_9ACTN|nr:PRC-barrel domain containing protein [Streptomyces sp. DSM 41527]MDT0457383.1 PRC-barrel domain containing protein [Streptomyces sp. DSM 41527]